jgi:hypothetical protein
MADVKFPELLTPREAAAIRRTTVGHLANERSRGIGPPVARIGGRIYYPVAELRQFINERIASPSRGGSPKAKSD